MHEWMGDNSHTPHIVVDTSVDGVSVPVEHIKDGKIILNISDSAAHNLKLTNDQNKSAVNRSYEIMGFQSCVEMGKEAFITANVTPNALKTEFLERFNRDGFSAAIKWVQARYAA